MPNPPPSPPPTPGGRRTQSQVLVELAASAELFHDEDTPYATFQCDGHRETQPLSSKGFRAWLGRRFFLVEGKGPGSQARQDALDVLTGRALFEGPQRSVHVRLARHAGAIYLDLGDEQWRAVRVTAAGWDVVDEPPVKFARRRGMLALPIPVRSGSIDALRPLVNAPDDATWRLMIGWLVAAFRPEGPYPVLIIGGEQGSAKSTACRLLRGLIDPNRAALRSAPRDERDLMIAATNCGVIAFDNLSAVPAALSDALCRLSTGGAFATRELFTDDGERLLEATRPVMFNGIERLATRPDLLERSIVLDLPPIADDCRATERDLLARYEAVRPGVLGALLDAVATAMRNLPNVRLARRPRMADFAEWVVAAEPALPWPAGAFLEAYGDNRGEANESAIEAMPVGPALVRMMAARATWTGTYKDLLAELDRLRGGTPPPPDWPATPRGLAGQLKRLAPALRHAGIDVRAGKHRKEGSVVTLERAGIRPPPPSPSPGDVPPPGAALKGPHDRPAGAAVSGSGDGDRGDDQSPVSSKAEPMWKVAGRRLAEALCAGRIDERQFDELDEKFARDWREAEASGRRPLVACADAHGNLMTALKAHDAGTHGVVGGGDGTTTGGSRARRATGM